MTTRQNRGMHALRHTLPRMAFAGLASSLTGAAPSCPYPN